MKKVEAYKTTGGHIFDDPEVAHREQFVCDMNDGIYELADLSLTSYSKLYNWILRNKELILKLYKEAEELNLDV